MFILEHQDGNIEYKFEKGGFAVIDEKLYLSVETKAIGEDAFPDCYLFAIEGYPFERGLNNYNFQISTHLAGEPPNVHVYTSFHAYDVKANIDLIFIYQNEIEVVLNVISEDVNYYNDQAKPNSFIGTVNLKEKNLREMWIPS